MEKGIEGRFNLGEVRYRRSYYKPKVCLPAAIIMLSNSLINLKLRKMVRARKLDKDTLRSRLEAIKRASRADDLYERDPHKYEQALVHAIQHNEEDLLKLMAQAFNPYMRINFHNCDRCPKLGQICLL